MRFVVLLLMSVAGLIAFDDDMTRVRVVVKNLDGKPVDRASVKVEFVEGRSIAKFGKKVMKRWEMRTSQEGIAKIPALPQGKLLIQIHAKGYQTFGQTYEVLEPEKTIEIKLNPPQPQFSAH